MDTENFPCKPLKLDFCQTLVIEAVKKNNLKYANMLVQTCYHVPCVYTLEIALKNGENPDIIKKAITLYDRHQVVYNAIHINCPLLLELILTEKMLDMYFFENIPLAGSRHKVNIPSHMRILVPLVEYGMDNIIRKYLSLYLGSNITYTDIDNAIEKTSHEHTRKLLRSYLPSYPVRILREFFSF